MFAYCNNNPVNCSDESGESWTLALAGGGTISSGLGLSLGSLFNTVSASLAAVSPVGLAVAGVTVIACVAVYAYAKANDENQTDGRITSPIGRRKTFNTRKKAYESAKKAGGGKEPRHDPNGHDGDNRPHFHPNVSKKYRQTPNGVSSHDHYFYPR